MTGSGGPGDGVLRNPAVRTPITRISALVAVGLLRARRDVRSDEFLDEAFDLAEGTG